MRCFARGARILMFGAWRLYNVVSVNVHRKYTVYILANPMKITHKRAKCKNTIEAPCPSSVLREERDSRQLQGGDPYRNLEKHFFKKICEQELELTETKLVF